MKGSVLFNKELSEGYYRMRIQCPEIAAEARPGAFLTIRISELYEPLLRRPFTIYSYDPGRGTIDVVYKVVGVGTLLMSERRRGDKLDLLGPLGNGFVIPSNEENMVLVAGGTGIAALHSLAQKVVAGRGGAEITALIGGAGAQDIICIDDFEKLGARVLVATEDGSMGEPGTVTDLLKSQLKGALHACDFTLYSCGPRDMLREVARLAEHHSLPCIVSLEGRMGCGIGACLGCVIRILPDLIDVEKAPAPVYRRICRDGPVFNAADVDWDAV